MSDSNPKPDWASRLQVPDGQSDDKIVEDGNAIAVRILQEIASYPHVGARERLLVGVVVSMIEVLVKEHQACPCAIGAHLGAHIEAAANKFRFRQGAVFMSGFTFHHEAVKEPFTGDSEL